MKTPALMRGHVCQCHTRERQFWTGIYCQRFWSVATDFRPWKLRNNKRTNRWNLSELAASAWRRRETSLWWIGRISSVLYVFVVTTEFEKTSIDCRNLFMSLSYKFSSVYIRGKSLLWPRLRKKSTEAVICRVCGLLICRVCAESPCDIFGWSRSVNLTEHPVKQIKNGKNKKYVFCLMLNGCH